MDKSFKNLIEAAKSILLLLPANPNFDQTAGGLALFLALKDKKQTTIACPTPMVVEFNRLIAVDKITKELGNKNLVISLADYNPDNLEKVSYDLEENGEMKLKIMTKPGGVPPREDQVKLTYTGVSADLVILIGGVDQTSFPDLTSNKDLAEVRLAHIGTEGAKIEGKDAISLARPASSISELIGALIKESGLEVDADMATNLIMGIEEGSKNFTDASVTGETFSMVGELMKLGGKRAGAVPPKGMFPPGAIPGEIPGQGGQVPQSWFDPKIYKGTSVS